MANNDDNNQNQPEKKDVVVWNVRYPDFKNINKVNEWKTEEIPLHELLKAIVEECTETDKVYCHIARLYHYKQTNYQQNKKRTYDYWNNRLSNLIKRIERDHLGKSKNTEEREKRDAEVVVAFYKRLKEYCEHPIRWWLKKVFKKIKKPWRNRKSVG